MPLGRVANDRLRYMRIGYARVSKADTSSTSAPTPWSLGGYTWSPECARPRGAPSRRPARPGVPGTTRYRVSRRSRRTSGTRFPPFPPHFRHPFPAVPAALPAPVSRRSRRTSGTRFPPFPPHFRHPFPAVPAALPAPDGHAPRAAVRRAATITARAGHRTRPVVVTPDAPPARPPLSRRFQVGPVRHASPAPPAVRGPRRRFLRRRQSLTSQNHPLARPPSRFFSA